MYSIVEEQNATFNGLGAGGEVFSNVVNSLTNAANSVATVTNSFANLNNSKQNNNSNSNGGSVVYIPSGNTTTSEKEKSDYLPWIIGGGVLLVGALLLMNGKRR